MSVKIELPDWMKVITGSLEEPDEDGDFDILLAEPIGFDPDTYTGISSKSFGNTLNYIPKTKKINLLLNTLGGRIDEGAAIYSMCAARGNVNTVVVGYAASMGAVIAQAGVQRKMMPGTCMIIHNPQGGGEGDYRDLESAISMLKSAKTSLVSLMAQRTKCDAKKISKMMDDVTSMDPEEAKELGFCDDIIKDAKMWNSISPHSAKSINNALRRMSNKVIVDLGANGQQTKKEETMKKLLIVLNGIGWVPNGDLTDEAAAAAVEGKIKDYSTMQNRVKKFEEQQKNRVTRKIDDAVTNKLIKPERKDAMIALGIADEEGLDAQLSDLAELKNSANPPANQQQQRRGAPGAPPVSQAPAFGNRSELDQQIRDLQDSMEGATAQQQTNIARQIRELRGKGKMFERKAA